MHSEPIKHSLNKIVDDIKSNNLIIYCGAGISRDSGIPIVNQIVPYILEKLDIDHSDYEKIYDLDSGLKMPFESFMECIHRNLNATEIFGIFDKGKPNKNHFFIANLFHKGLLSYVVTTNFDKLIERANESLNSILDCEVIFSESHFEKLLFAKGRKALIKIHGSVDNKEEMIITLKQVSSHKSVPSREHIINQAFAKGDHKSVLILGYSSSDIFDLNIYIESITENFKNVYYIEHFLDKPYEENINLKSEKNPFINFSNGVRIYADTGEIINYLLRKLFDDEIIKCENTTLNWKVDVDIWFDRTEIAPFNKYCSLAEVFNKIGHFDLTIKYYLKYLNSLTDDYYRVEVMAELIDCYRLNSQPEEAINIGLEALKINDSKFNLHILNLLCSVYLDNGDLEKAEEMFQKGLNTPDLNNHELSNLHALGAKINQQKVDYKSAINNIKKSIEYKKRSGNYHLDDEFKLNGDLALFLIQNGEFDEAISSLKDLLKKAMAANDKLSITSFKTDLALAYFCKDDINLMNEFINELPDVLSICTENKNLARCHQIAGKIYLYKLYNTVQAITHLEKAVEHSTLNKNRRAICMNHTSLGISHYISAINLKEQDNDGYSPTEYKHHVIECKANLMQAKEILKPTDIDLVDDINLYLSLQEDL